jgi:hypothetical protein
LIKSELKGLRKISRKRKSLRNISRITPRRVKVEV